MNTNVKIFVSVIAIVIIGTITTAVMRGAGSAVVEDGKYDALATCLKDKGAIFYGAFWCPHCQATKKLFGSSQKLLPYVECSTPDAQGQTQVCIDKGIKSYPTWEFADGTRMTGEIPLATLAEKTACELPAEDTAVTPPAAEEGASSPVEADSANGAQ